MSQASNRLEVGVKTSRAKGISRLGETTYGSASQNTGDRGSITQARTTSLIIMEAY